MWLSNTAIQTIYLKSIQRNEHKPYILTYYSVHLYEQGMEEIQQGSDKTLPAVCRPLTF